jgi:hypothetical protein
LLAPVHRGFPGKLPAAGGLDDAPVHREVLQVQSDDSVVGFQAQLLQGGEDSSGDPFIAPPPDGGRRAGGVADLLVRGPQDEDLDQFVEDHAVWDPWAVATQGVVVLHRRDQGLELAPEGFDEE